MEPKVQVIWISQVFGLYIWKLKIQLPKFESLIWSVSVLRLKLPLNQPKHLSTSDVWSKLRQLNLKFSDARYENLRVPPVSSELRVSSGSHSRSFFSPCTYSKEKSEFLSVRSVTLFQRQLITYFLVACFLGGRNRLSSIVMTWLNYPPGSSNGSRAMYTF